MSEEARPGAVDVPGDAPGNLVDVPEDMAPEAFPKGKSKRSAAAAVRRAAQGPAAPEKPHVRLLDLIERDRDAELTVWSALGAAGFVQQGDTFRDSVAGLQRYLGNRPTGRPGRHELTWLALRTQSFTTD